MKDESKNQSLFDDSPLWKQHWVGMPEFIMEDHSPRKSLIIHFRCEEDVLKFSKLIDQSINPKQKSIWYPRAENRKIADKVYVDES
jgi:hypothetical protein